MSILLLVLGIVLLFVYVNPEFRDRVCSTLGISYDPAMDMIVSFLASGLLIYSLGLLPGLLICVLAFYYRSRQVY